jgi:predicted CXXCH cytochrome family protein
MQIEGRIRSSIGNQYLSGFVLGLFMLLFAEILPATQSKPEASDDICLKCHNQVEVALRKKYKHKALEKGCLVCHMDCREVTPTSNRHNVPPHYLKRTGDPALCLDCHTSDKKDLSAIHDNQLFAQAKCVSCHEPHASNSPKLIPDVSHGPYAARECSACHEMPVDGKVKLVKKDIDVLCDGCHADIKARIDRSTHKHRIVSKDKPLIKSESSCVECHDAHATNQKYILKKPEQALCIRCHQDLTARKTYIHRPVSLSCIFCHDAHASDVPKTLHVPVRELCLGCHGPDSSKIINSRKAYPLFEDKVSLPPNVFEKLGPLGLSSDGKTGHPVEGHPIHVDQSANKPGLDCLSCHTAHASATSPNLLVSDRESLCLRCHDK